jgi:transglutaminase-like putative cysteine protease
MSSRLKLEEGWFTLFLVWALVMTTSAALLDANLIAGLEMVPFVATVGIFTGLLLSKSRFRARTAHLFALAYGIFLITFLAGRSYPDNKLWQERVFDLVSRQVDWVVKAFTERSSRDGMIFVLQTSGVFWLLAYTAAWYTFRLPRVWRVVMPSGLVLLSIVYYYYGPRPLTLFLALYALIALLYIARTHLVAQEKIWQATIVRYEKDIRLNFLQASFAVALVALLLAWALPTAEASTAVSNVLGETGVSETWRKFQDDWTRLFSSLRSYGIETGDAFGDVIALGGPRSVGNSLIMDVYVPRPLSYVYWHAAVYDTYEDGGWYISNSRRVLHLPDEGQLAVEPTRLREEVLQTFINYVPNAATIYGAPQLLNTDRQMYVDQSIDDAGNAHVYNTLSRFVMRQGERYQVVSGYSVADATSLRQAPQEYPGWIAERYLQLPDTITPETIALAQEVTAPYDNPFDKALAVRDYLRANVAYNDQIAAPPQDVEPVHYILFESREGYCNYYATAMVVMLRSQGVPARFVAGYAQGEWDDVTGSYRVRANNAHTWVEVYFPNYGWIPFEPTASLPAADRPETGGNPGDAFASLGTDAAGDQAGENPLEDFERFGDVPLEERGTQDLGADQSGNRLSILQAALAVIVIGLAVGLALFANNWNRRIESSVERSYGRLGSWAERLGLMFRPTHTPYERASMLSVEVPLGREPLRRLAHQYVRLRFSQAQASDPEFEPRQEWKILRPLLLRQAIIRQLARLRKPKAG